MTPVLSTPTHRSMGNAWCGYVLSRDWDGTDASSDALDLAFLLHLSNMHRRPTLDVDVVNHCNLNCASCCHFAPIAEPGFLPIEDFERDLALLSGISHVEDFFDAMCIMGGEPLLHPQLAEFFMLTRGYLPRIGLRLVTNGILFQEVPDELWDALRDARARILMTSYPVGVDYQELQALAEVHGVHASVGGGLTRSKDGKAYFVSTPMDPLGGHDPSEAFVSCPLGGTVMQMRDGRIYPCNTSALVDRLNARFGTGFVHEQGDYLELASIAHASEIDDFRRTPKPLCGHCVQARTRRIDWGPSGRLPEEWLLIDEGDS